MKLHHYGKLTPIVRSFFGLFLVLLLIPVCIISFRSGDQKAGFLYLVWALPMAYMAIWGKVPFKKSIH